MPYYVAMEENDQGLSSTLMLPTLLTVPSKLQIQVFIPRAAVDW